MVIEQCIFFALFYNKNPASKIGNSLGARRPEDARAYSWISLLWIAIYGVLNAGIYELFLRR